MNKPPCRLLLLRILKVGLPMDRVPLEYSIEWLTCIAAACSPEAVMLGWAGAAQDRVRADLADAQ